MFAIFYLQLLVLLRSKKGGERANDSAVGLQPPQTRQNRNLKIPEHVYTMILKLYIHGSVHRHSILIRSSKMQQMQVFITANLFYMFRVSIAPIIRSTSNCNCNFWYRSYHVSGQRPAWPKVSLAEGRCSLT